MPNLREKTWTTTTPATVGDAQFWEDHLISDTDAAKISTSVQTVNNTAPDANGNVDVVALPPGGTTGQVLTKVSNTSGDADWEDPASGGHTIQDDNGTSMTQRPILQFENADVTDDSVNGKTIVDCKGAKGDAATVDVGTTTTGAAGTNASVTNSGTTSAAIFDFTIPRGADGDDGADGVSVTGVSLISTSGKVKTYRMTFSNNTYFDFDVTDGADGTGAGDMLKADYDSDSAVYNAGGIKAYVSSAVPEISNTYSSTSADGMSGIAVAGALAGLVIPVITNTYSATSEDGMSGKAVASAISGKADSSSLAPVATSGSYNDLSNKPTIPAAQIQSDWNQADSTAKDFIKNKPSVLGHTMIPVSGDMDAIAALNNGNDNYVVNAYSAKRWSNCEAKEVLTTVSQDADGVGTWEDDATWETGSRSGWLWSSELYQVLEDGDGNTVLDIDISPVFDIGKSETVGLLSYRIDDDYPRTIDGVTVNGGCVAFKFTGAIKSASGVKVGLKLVHQRTEVNDGTILT